MTFVVMVVLGSMVMLRYLSYETGESSWRFIGGAALVLLLISRQLFRFTRRKPSIS